MSFVKEFREFAVKGNVVDLAVGVIIGAAFSKIVDSVVKDLIMPIVGLIERPKKLPGSITQAVLGPDTSRAAEQPKARSEPVPEGVA